MIKTLLEKVIAGNDLDLRNHITVMLNIMSGEVNNSQIAALLNSIKN